MRVIGCLGRFAVAAGLLAAAPAAAEVGDARIEQARREVLDARYQPELPRNELAVPAPAARTDAAPPAAAGRDAPPAARASGALSSVMTMVLWAVVIAIGAIVGVWLVGELRRGGDAALPEAPPAPAPVDPAAIERPLGDADELAHGGRFAEAIHTLLLRTLEALARGAQVPVAPAMTSREILARVPLLDEPRRALAELIAAVEVTHFGDAPASAGDYARCRDRFHALAAALRGPAQVAA